MARKAKVDNAILKRQRTNWKRTQAVRNKRKYYLVVCEGSETEPNYFEAFKNDLPKAVLDVYEFKIEGTGFNTLSLVAEAERIKTNLQKQTMRPVDKIWIVFDRDSFAPQDFNAAIERCNQTKNMEAAWSNEAFELWYLLHFHFYNTAMSRKQYQQLIEENLRPFLGNDYKYEKNSKNMYAVLKEYGNIEQAIEFAKRLEDNFKGRADYANHNPCTLIWKLVDEVRKL
jgi:RloB-like protein